MNRVVRQIEIAKRKMESWPRYLRREGMMSNAAFNYHIKAGEPMGDEGLEIIADWAGDLLFDKDREIETLRRDKAHLEETCNAEKERGDEWKRRIDIIGQWGSSFIMLGGFTFWEQFLREHPEAKDWFEEE